MLKQLASILRHPAEFGRYLRNFQYEVGEYGQIVFPKASLVISGVWQDFINGVPQPYSRNLVVNQGLNHALDVLLLGGTQIGAAAWYIGLASGAVTPQASWTGANVATNFTEITSTTQGYTEANRQAFTGAANTGNTSVDNSASKAAFTIAASAPPLTVRGAFLVGSDNARGGTTGTLLSAVRYASDRTLNDGDDYESQYEVDFNTP